jgi:hypothetical protein
MERVAQKTNAAGNISLSLHPVPPLDFVFVVHALNCQSPEWGIAGNKLATGNYL